MNAVPNASRPPPADDPEAVTPQAFVMGAPEYFPAGMNTFDWFVRHNRAELVAAGALLRPTGRWLVRPAAFKQVLSAVGARRALGG